MMRLLPLVAGAAYAAWTGWRSHSHYSAVGRVTAAETPPPPEAWPFVSIIIPARNEAHNLPRLLVSLRGGGKPNGPATGRATGGPPHEVIVVDDASSDATGELATALGARVLRLEEHQRPAGWMGKPNACWQGAGIARGEWLLFLDADTTLRPDALAQTVSYALEQNVDALSLLLQQRCDTFWERLLLPFAYQQLFAGIGRAGLGGSRGDGEAGGDHGVGAILNGQFILIRQAVYAAVGGHGAVRDSIIEDVALARVLASRGHCVETLRGEHLGSVRMYRDLVSIREGFGKNAYALLAGQPLRGMRVALSSACAGATLPLLGHAARTAGGDRLAALGGMALAWAALAAGLAGWATRYNVPARYALGQPLAATVFNGIAIESTIRSLTGGAVTWKGRRYVVGSMPPPPAGQPAHPHSLAHSHTTKQGEGTTPA